jgi:hypothetical protein
MANDAKSFSLSSQDSDDFNEVSHNKRSLPQIPIAVTRGLVAIAMFMTVFVGSPQSSFAAPSSTKSRSSSAKSRKRKSSSRKRKGAKSARKSSRSRVPEAAQSSGTSVSTPVTKKAIVEVTVADSAETKAKNKALLNKIGIVATTACIGNDIYNAMSKKEDTTKNNRRKRIYAPQTDGFEPLDIDVPQGIAKWRKRIEEMGPDAVKDMEKLKALEGIKSPSFPKLPSGGTDVVDDLFDDVEKDEKPAKPAQPVPIELEASIVNAAKPAEDKSPVVEVAAPAEEEDAPADEVTENEIGTGATSDSAKPRKGFFGRVFRNKGRSTDMVEVLDAEGVSEQRQYRKSVAKTLCSGLPSSLFPELRRSSSENVDIDSAVKLVKDEMDNLEIEAQSAADAFAAVTSCMVVSMVDRCVDALDAAGDDAAVDALDDLMGLIGNAASIFKATVTDCTVEPVVYNGKVRKKKIESLYLAYSKKAMDLGGLLGSLTGGEGADGEAGAGAGAVDRSQNLGQMQQVLGISDNRRASLDQQIMRKMIMGMAKGEGELDLSGMLGALGGGDDGAMPDMSQLMGQLGGGDLGDLGDLGDFDPSSMNPEDMAAMSADALQAVKSSLADGSITKDDVKELEKVMGSDIGQLVGMMKAGNVDKEKLKELGPDFQEMLDIFGKLADIKNAP